MSDFLSRMRRLTGSNDARAAHRAEQAAVALATEQPTVDPRFRAEMTRLTTADTRSVGLGRAYADEQLDVRTALSDVAGTGHALVLGGNGAGKTRLVAGVARQLLRRIAHHPESLGLWITDHKSEFCALMRKLLADVVDELPAAEATRLMDNYVVIDPFSSSALVPLQILRPEPGVPAEVQAFEVTSLIDRLGGAELGVRQDSFLFHLMLLAITRGLSLPEVAALLSDPVALIGAASGSPFAEVRAYFSGVTRIAPASLDGVRARLHRLLRLPATRFMLGAKDSISFRALLESKIVFVDIGSPPLGCEDIGRFWAGLLTTKLTRAIFQRSHEDAVRPVVCFIDEWQEGLAGGADIAEHYERVLSMARSRGVSLWLISQSLAGAAKVSASLPKVVATNTNVQLLFRASIEDARAMTHLLPITGRKPRPRAAPWNTASRSLFLSSSEELQALVNQVPSLPERVFYYWNRRRPYPAELVRASDVTPRETGFIGTERWRRLRDGVLAVPIPPLKLATELGDEAAFRPVLASPIPLLTRPRKAGART